MRFAPESIQNAIRDIEGLERDIAGMCKEKRHRVESVLADMSTAQNGKPRRDLVAIDE